MIDRIKKAIKKALGIESPSEHWEAQSLEHISVFAGIFAKYCDALNLQRGEQ